MNELDAALLRFARCAPAYGPPDASGEQRANLGPMAAEALAVLGHPALTPALVDVYAPRLPDFEPGPSMPEAARRASLGEPARLAEHVAGFAIDLERLGWREVLATWLPRLLPGCSAAGTHALLRTAHAARAVAAEDNEVRRCELAIGLGYWSSHYRVPPRGTPGGDASDLLAAPGGPALEAIGRLCVTGAERYLAHPEARAAASAGVTAPSALRLLVAHLREEELLRAAGHVRRAVTAIPLDADRGARSTAVARPGARAEVERLAGSPAEIRYRAACSLAEHAIILAEACLREDAARPDPRLRLAAADAALEIEPSHAARG